MTDSKLQDVFNRIEAGEILSQQDWSVLKAAVRSRQVTIQGSAERAVIVTGDGNTVGDRNFVISGTNLEAIYALLRKRTSNEQKLLSSVKNQIMYRLKTGLLNEILIKLDLEAQAEKVRCPWDAEVKISFKSSETIPEDTPLIEIFDREDITGRLLILGSPGSGKTTIMLELAKELVNRAEQEASFPIPILLNLASWQDDRQTIDDWVISEIKSKYGISKNISRNWLKEQKLLLMLDSLDEVEALRQERCAKAINRLLREENRPPYIVVASRIQEYDKLSVVLELRGAFRLKPINDHKIQDYLSKINQHELGRAIHSDPTLLKLAQVPMTLMLMILFNEKATLEEWTDLKSAEDPAQYLWEKFSQEQLTAPKRITPYSSKKSLDERKAERWLAYLAKQLERESKTEFLIEKMQPSWLIKPYQKLVYRLLFGVFFSAISALILGFSSGLIPNETVYSVPYKFLFWTLSQTRREASFSFQVDWMNVLAFGIFGFIFGLFYKSTEIKIVETLIWTRWGALVVLSVFSLLGLVVGLEDGNVVSDVFTAFVYSLLVAPIVLFFQVKYGEMEEKIEANQGIYKSIVNAGFCGLVLGMIGAVYGVLAGALAGGNNSGIYAVSYALIGALLMGSLGALKFGGISCIQHSALRFTLWCNGYIPWNYARFLDYCVECRLIERVGGRYLFIHKSLQDQFAAIPLERKECDVH